MEEQVIADLPQTQNIPPVPRVKLKHISLFGVLLSVFLLLSIAVVVYFAGKPQELRKKATGNGVSMALTPASKTVTVNDTFSLGITISTSGTQQVSAAQISLDYDPTAIEITEGSVGSALPVLLFPKSINEAINNGRITVTLGAVAANPPTAPSGSFIVGTLTAKARKAGTTSLNFTSASDANIVTVLSYPTNALETTTGSQITIEAPTTPIPIPTDTSTPIPTDTPTPTATPIPTPTPEPINTPIPTATPVPGTTVTPAPTTLQGDITGEEGMPDGIVDLFDYNKILTYYVQHYGETGTLGFTPEDITGEEGVPDGIVDVFDVNFILNNYGKTR